MFERWAILHAPSGYFLPQSNSKRHGYTHDEPVSMAKNRCPRLFARKQDAKTALTWWLKGETSMRYSGGAYANIWEDWHIEVRVNRKADDMKVVKVELEIAL